MDRRTFLELLGTSSVVAGIGGGIIVFAGPDREHDSTAAGSEQPAGASTAGEPSAAAPTRPSTDRSTSASTPTTGQGRSGGQHTVEMTDDLTFIPDTLEITAGDTVVWNNGGSVTHTVTAYEDQIPDGAVYFASGGFESESAARNGFPDGSVGGGESYTVTFETTGSYKYFCIPHEQIGMTGTITVG